MTNLLIHSMSEFSDIIFDCLQQANAKNIVEIGAEHGGMSAKLAQFVQKQSGQFISIDPAPQEAFVQWMASQHEATHIADTSLNALPFITGIDAWIVDGDHNWYTVYHELKLIYAACQRDEKPLLVFLHDVGWPNARRDSYYSPENIPQEFLHPYDYHSGATLDSETLIPGRGFRGNGNFAYAIIEGGPKNGVLTAVEDFASEIAIKETTLAYAHIPAVFGLGVLFDMNAPWSKALASILMPYHNSKLIKTLEENRLRNYLTVIEWQDRVAGQIT